MNSVGSLGWIGSFCTISLLELKGAELQSPLRWISALINPVAYFGLLGVGLASQFAEPTYLAFIVPGVMVMQAISSMTQMIYRTVIERRWGLAALKLQAGVPWTAYLAGLLVPRILLFLMQIAAIGSLAMFVTPGLSWSRVALSVLAATSACIFWSLLGLTITGWIRSYQVRDFVVGLIVTPLAFAAPVFYSLDSAPGVLRALSVVNPLTYQVGLVRSVLLGSPDVGSSVVSMLLIAAVVVAARGSVKSMRKLSFEA
ncbi:ABC transporter permease [Micropruina sp.]|uniref:ABC transporter permease n=1 Tax=Micropruina sp. TaxID=2737536 RepID=UPI0039E34DB4